MVFQWHSQHSLYTSKIGRRLSQELMPLCFKVGASLEELEYIFLNESRARDAIWVLCDCTIRFICMHNHETTFQKWPMSSLMMRRIRRRHCNGKRWIQSAAIAIFLLDQNKKINIQTIKKNIRACLLFALCILYCEQSIVSMLSIDRIQNVNII